MRGYEPLCLPKHLTRKHSHLSVPFSLLPADLRYYTGDTSASLVKLLFTN